MAYSIDFRKKVLSYCERTGSITEASHVFQISRNTIYGWLKLKEKTGELNHQVKGTKPRKVDRDRLKNYLTDNPDAYLTEIAFDETGFDTYFYREYGRSLKGQLIRGKVSGRRYQRISLVAGLTNGELIAPMTYEEMVTSDFFEAWFQKFLLPTLTTPSVIIMDNARFHRMGKLEL
ncbi:IS630 transposase-related protein, partial [Streptococcus pneumoniae]|uniref:IS630 transposase-related protein n=1 Tax=Streptococcus pneumoniae TaxID=1313 RepID=UPI0012948339